MEQRKLQPGFVAAGLSGFFLAVFWFVGMPWPIFPPLALFFGALIWFGFDAGGLPPCERKLQAYSRSAIVFFAAALCDVALEVAGPLRFAHTTSILFSLLPVSQGIAALWERSRLSKRLRSALGASR